MRQIRGPEKGDSKIFSFGYPLSSPFTSLYTLHKCETVYRRALDFIPERWLESKGAKEREEMFFTFIKGGRGCLGKKYVHKSSLLSDGAEILTRRNSLAMAEKKILLREVYSQCTTSISEHIDGDMEMADQIISSRPRG
jgi:hypothetical protein